MVLVVRWVVGPRSRSAFGDGDGDGDLGSSGTGFLMGLWVFPCLVLLSFYHF